MLSAGLDSGARDRLGAGAFARARNRIQVGRPGSGGLTHDIGFVTGSVTVSSWTGGLRCTELI